MLTSLFDDLGGRVRTAQMPAGEVLVRAGEAPDHLYRITAGAFDVHAGHQGRSVVLATLGPGDVVGEISLLGGGPATATVTATAPSTVQALPVQAAIAHLDDDAAAAEHLASEIRARVDRHAMALLLADLIGPEGDEWVATAVDELIPRRLWSGETLITQGDTADAAYLVVSGRLAIVRDGLEIARAGRGQVVGEAGLLEDRPRNATVTAVRDSVVAELRVDAFRRMLAASPVLFTRLTRQVVERLRRPDATQRHAVSVIAVGAASTAATAELAGGVVTALQPFGRVGHLTARAVDAALGRDGISQTEPGDPAAHRLDAHLHEMELAYDVIVVELGSRADTWAARAAGMADRVLLAVDAGADGQDRRSLQAVRSQLPDTTTVIVVITHPSDADRPRNSAAVRDELAADDVLHVRRGVEADVARVARLAASRGVALVLGGGGARGFAHLGVHRALRELDVPIDVVVGASIGAPLGGGIACGLDPDELLPVVRDLFERLLDYTIPVVSLVRGQRITRAIERQFGTWDFEDLWIPFRCVTTNLTRARTEVHRRGPTAPMIRASVAIPGVLPPVPCGDDLLVDGGVLDNLPVDVVTAEGRCSTIIAVDVAPPTGPRARGDYGLSVSGWQALRASVGRRRSAFPGITAVLMRSMLVASLKDRAQALADADLDLHLELPLRRVGLLAFDEVDTVAQEGYDLARPEIEAWLAERGT